MPIFLKYKYLSSFEALFAILLDINLQGSTTQHMVDWWFILFISHSLNISFSLYISYTFSDSDWY